MTRQKTLFDSISKSRDSPSLKCPDTAISSRNPVESSTMPEAAGEDMVESRKDGEPIKLKGSTFFEDWSPIKWLCRNCGKYFTRIKIVNLDPEERRKYNQYRCPECDTCTVHKTWE